MRWGKIRGDKFRGIVPLTDFLFRFQFDIPGDLHLMSPVTVSTLIGGKTVVSHVVSLKKY